MLSVEEMIDEAPEELKRHQLRMTYFLIDERRTRVRLSEVERNTVAAVLALEQSKVGSEAFEAICILLSFLREPQYESLRQAFKSFVLRALAPELAPIAEIFDHPEDLMTRRLKTGWRPPARKSSTFGRSGF